METKISEKSKAWHLAKKQSDQEIPPLTLNQLLYRVFHSPEWKERCEAFVKEQGGKCFMCDKESNHIARRVSVLSIVEAIGLNTEKEILEEPSLFQKTHTVIICIECLRDHKNRLIDEAFFKKRGIVV